MQVCHDAVQLRHELVTSDMNVALRRSDQRLIHHFSNSLCAQNYQLPITNYRLTPATPTQTLQSQPCRPLEFQPCAKPRPRREFP